MINKETMFSSAMLSYIALQCVTLDCKGYIRLCNVASSWVALGLCWLTLGYVWLHWITLLYVELWWVTLH